LDRRDLVSNNEVEEWIKRAFDQGYCIYTYVNEFYVPGRNSYQKYDNDHDLLLSGYDEERSIYHAASFIKANYVEFELKMEDFNQAYSHVNMTYDYIRNIRILKPAHSFQYRFNVTLVVEMLTEYLNSTNNSDKFSTFFYDERLVYGINVYQELIRFIGRIKKTGVQYDVRPFHVL
jgi:hypothetical protein